MEKEEKILKKTRHRYILLLLLFVFVVLLMRPNDTRPSIVFAGVSKGIKEEQIKNIVTKLSHLGNQIASDYHFVIYDNDSTASQIATWREALGTRGTFVTESLEPISPRTKKMAFVRNKLLDLVSNSPVKDFDYLWMQDLDGACGGSGYSADIFNEVFMRSSEWDVVSFVYLPYWDLWAFRHPIMFPYNMYGRHGRSNPPRESVTRVLENYMGVPVAEREFIPVESAFMMTAIHKMSVIHLSHYGYKDINGDVDCEHVSYYRGLGQQGVRVRLWPVVFCEVDPGYTLLNT